MRSATPKILKMATSIVPPLLRAIRHCNIHKNVPMRRPQTIYDSHRIEAQPIYNELLREGFIRIDQNGYYRTTNLGDELMSEHKIWENLHHPDPINIETEIDCRERLRAKYEFP